MSEAALSSEPIKESFDPKLVTALYRNFSDQYMALLELIDNAVDDKAEDRGLIIEITFGESGLSIKNYDGNGMGYDDIVRFFQWGISGKQRRIGRYGQGGKAALGYLGRGFSIKTHPAGTDKAYYLEVQDWQDRSDGFKHIEVQPYTVSSSEGSVEIRVLGLQKSFTKDILIRRIADTYRPLILGSQVMFVVDDETVECKPANYDEGTKKSFTIPFVLGGMEYRIRGEHGIVSDLSSRGGFNIYQFGRRVAKGEYFGHRDPSKKWNLERLYGEVFIDFEVPLLMNKTDADRDSSLWRKITELMHTEIEPVIRIAAEYQKPTEKEIKSVAGIGKKLRKKEGVEKFDIELANYGPSLLFKLREEKDGSTTLLINREHRAYERWSATAVGKRLYAVMIYSLYAATKELPKKEAGEWLKLFSKSLSEQTHKLL